jgi:hypothetical protein
VNCRARNNAERANAIVDDPNGQIVDEQQSQLRGQSAGLRPTLIGPRCGPDRLIFATVSLARTKARFVVLRLLFAIVTASPLWPRDGSRSGSTRCNPEMPAAGQFRPLPPCVGDLPETFLGCDRGFVVHRGTLGALALRLMTVPPDFAASPKT